MNTTNEIHYVLKECLIDDKIVRYDVCAESSLEQAKEYYGKKYKYIGSSHTYYLNKHENKSILLHHFFILA